jgi:hypothetical protein
MDTPKKLCAVSALTKIDAAWPASGIEAFAGAVPGK